MNENKDDIIIAIIEKDSLSINEYIRENSEGFIEVISELKIYNDSMPKILKYFESYNKIKDIDLESSNLILEKINDELYSINTRDLLDDAPISDETLKALISDLASSLLYYDRKSDSEISPTRINSYLSKNKDKIDLMIEEFKKSILEALD